MNKVWSYGCQNLDAFVLGQLPAFPDIRQPLVYLADRCRQQIRQQLREVQLGIDLMGFGTNLVLAWRHYADTNLRALKDCGVVKMPAG